MKDLRENISRLRKEKKLSQEKLAEMLDVSRQTVANWEANITSLDINQAKKLSKIFNVSLDELGGVDIRKNVLVKLKETEKLTNMIWILLIIILSFQVLMLAISYLYDNKDNNLQTKSIYCKQNGATFLIEYTYNREDLKLVKVGALKKYVTELNLSDYVYAYDLTSGVIDYVEANNGMCVEVNS